MRCDVFGCVDHDQRDLAAFDRFSRGNDGEFLRLVRRLSFASDAGGVDDDVSAAVALNLRIDRVARGAGDRRHNGALLLQQPVEQRRLADVWPANDRHAHRLVFRLLLLLGRFGWNDLGDCIDDLVDAFAVFGRDRNQALVSELVKLRHVLFCIAAIDFVDEQQRSRCSRPQLGGDIAILGHHSGRAIDDEQDQIGLLDRPAGLGANLRRVGGHRRIAVFEPAGVGELKSPAIIELHDFGEAVAGHPGKVVDKRAPLSGKAIE